MCSRFFIDFPDVDTQRVKLEHYLADHFSDDLLRHQYLATLWTVRTVCTLFLLYTHTHAQPFYSAFWDHPGEPVPEENFWTLWCKGRLTEAETPTIRLGATPSGLTSAHLHHPPIFLRARCPSCRPTNSVKALKATSAFGLGRRR